MSKYDSDFTRRVTETIEQKRRDKGMTIDDLCKAAGIGRNSYYTKQRGERCFNTEEIDAIAKALGCDALLLLEEAACEPTDEEAMIRATLRRLQEHPDELVGYLRDGLSKAALGMAANEDPNSRLEAETPEE